MRAPRVEVADESFQKATREAVNLDETEEMQGLAEFDWPRACFLFTSPALFLLLVTGARRIPKPKRLLRRRRTLAVPSDIRQCRVWFRCQRIFFVSGFVSSRLIRILFEVFFSFSTYVSTWNRSTGTALAGGVDRDVKRLLFLRHVKFSG
jgi:hypothetical protein